MVLKYETSETEGDKDNNFQNLYVRLGDQNKRIWSERSKIYNGWIIEEIWTADIIVILN